MVRLWLLGLFYKWLSQDNKEKKKIEVAIERMEEKILKEIEEL